MHIQVKEYKELLFMIDCASIHSSTLSKSSGLNEVPSQVALAIRTKDYRSLM